MTRCSLTSEMTHARIDRDAGSIWGQFGVKKGSVWGCFFGGINGGNAGPATGWLKCAPAQLFSRPFTQNGRWLTSVKEGAIRTPDGSFDRQTRQPRPVDPRDRGHHVG